MDTIYELTEGTREEFNKVQEQLISDFIQQVTGAEVENQLLGTGKIVSCLNPNNNFETVIFTIHFDLDETKNYGAVAAMSCGGLKFIDESMAELYDSFVEVHTNLKHQLSEAEDEARRRQKEAEKKAKQKEAQEKKKQKPRNLQKLRIHLQNN